MSLVEATRSYERWLRGQTTVVARHLEAKHEAMSETPFTLLRASFYRWMQLWEEHAANLARAPRVLAVGDLHVENFGTWRDAEGRLIWGVNDFDEAFPLPFTLDLVRLATSAHLAIRDHHLSVRAEETCDAVLEGYLAGLEAGGRPFVLAEHNTWLWRLAVNDLRDPKRFWRDQAAKCTTARPPPPASLVGAIRRTLPKTIGPLRVFVRMAGKGSLGRQRFLFQCDWNAGITSREAKALVPSACAWAAGMVRCRVYYREIVSRARRAPDASVRLHDAWIIRRLAPDCSKIDLAHLPSGRDESKLLWAMGFETANIHLGTTGARPRILKFLRSQPRTWLHEASQIMANAVRSDWSDWREAI